MLLRGCLTALKRRRTPFSTQAIRENYHECLLKLALFGYSDKELCKFPAPTGFSGSFFSKEAVFKIQRIKELSKYVFELKDAFGSECDPALKSLIETDTLNVEEEKSRLSQDLVEVLFQGFCSEIDSVTVEIRPAAGGTEAALFATELQEVLTAYCAHRRWDYDVISSSTIGRQTKEAIVSVDGASYADLYFESGVHRVQRVPDTDSQGRIHTSTVTIAVLPKYRSGSVTLDEKDIRMDVYRSSGPGGQNANKTNSAVRLVHIPTGLTVCMQDERSQSQNKVLALRVLQYRVEQRAYTESLLRKQANRSEQIGSGERAEKIRTYNFAQNRLTDHRVGYSAQNLDAFFGNPSILQEIIHYNQLDFLSREMSRVVTEESLLKQSGT